MELFREDALVLKDVAGLVNSSIREGDLFARFGGEEFIILLTGASKTVAWEIVERIRKSISQSPVNFEGRPIPVSASFGVAPVLPGTGLDDLIARADQALYKAKEGGRDQAVFCEERQPI
jgi:diguanylate cyclase (GGDEF)-like protein